MGILIVLTQNLQYFRFLQYLLLFVNLRNEIDLFWTQTYIAHWKSQYSKRYIVILTKFPLAAREITLLTTSGTTSDKNFVKMTQDFRFREGKYSDNIYYVKNKALYLTKNVALLSRWLPEISRVALTGMRLHGFVRKFSRHNETHISTQNSQQCSANFVCAPGLWWSGEKA